MFDLACIFLGFFFLAFNSGFVCIALFLCWISLFCLFSNFEHVNIDEPELSMRMSLASDSTETVNAIIIKLATATAPDMRTHHMLISLTLTFVQGYTDLNHENSKCLIISETVQEMPIKFAVKIAVQLKVSMTIASMMTLTFIQGHECISNLTNV